MISTASADLPGHEVDQLQRLRLLARAGEEEVPRMDVAVGDVAGVHVPWGIRPGHLRQLASSMLLKV